MSELRPPVDFTPPIADREPTLAELLEAWDDGERARKERERARLWNEARALARRAALDDLEVRGIPAPGWIGPYARRALPAPATAGRVAQAGIDTWSPSWYVPDSSEAARALADLVPAHGYAGRVLEGDALGHRVIWFPDAALLAAEGHPAQGRLASPNELPQVHDQLRHAVAELIGADVREEWTAGVRRLDATCDVPHEEPAEGLALLSGVAALAVGGVQSVVRRAASSRRTCRSDGYRPR